jgi:hypothetical protein
LGWRVPLRLVVDGNLDDHLWNRLQEEFDEDLDLEAILQSGQWKRVLHIQSIIQALVHTWDGTQYLGVLEYGIDWRQAYQSDPLLEGLYVCMRAHIDDMDEQVEDWLQHYECFHPILVHLIVDDLGLHIDDVAEPV